MPHPIIAAGSVIGPMLWKKVVGIVANRGALGQALAMAAGGELVSTAVNYIMSDDAQSNDYDPQQPFGRADSLGGYTRVIRLDHSRKGLEVNDDFSDRLCDYLTALLTDKDEDNDTSILDGIKSALDIETMPTVSQLRSICRRSPMKVFIGVLNLSKHHVDTSQYLVSMFGVSHGGDIHLRETEFDGSISLGAIDVPSDASDIASSIEVGLLMSDKMHDRVTALTYEEGQEIRSRTSRLESRLGISLTDLSDAMELLQDPRYHQLSERFS